MNDWLLVYNGYRPEEEGLREALCTLGNGYFATHGAVLNNVAYHRDPTSHGSTLS
jgi:trehalose/maltose hydrolase-like predicted phosphorylase